MQNMQTGHERHEGARVVRTAPVYLTEDEARLLIDRLGFHPNTDIYVRAGERVGLKIVAALLELTAAPLVETAIVLVERHGGHGDRDA